MASDYVPATSDRDRCIMGGPVGPAHHCAAITHDDLVCGPCQTDSCDCPACLRAPCGPDCAWCGYGGNTDD